MQKPAGRKTSGSRKLQKLQERLSSPHRCCRCACCRSCKRAHSGLLCVPESGRKTGKACARYSDPHNPGRRSAHRHPLSNARRQIVHGNPCRHTRKAAYFYPTSELYSGISVGRNKYSIARRDQPSSKCREFHSGSAVGVNPGSTPGGAL